MFEDLLNAGYCLMFCRMLKKDGVYICMSDGALLVLEEGSTRTLIRFTWLLSLQQLNNCIGRTSPHGTHYC